MSEPVHARRGGNEEPRPDPTPDEQVTGHGDHLDRAARAWFHRTAPGSPAPRAVTPPTWAPSPPTPDDDHATSRRPALYAVPDARPTAKPEKPTALRAPGEHPRQLTDDEIFSFIARDPTSSLKRTSIATCSSTGQSTASRSPNSERAHEPGRTRQRPADEHQ